MTKASKIVLLIWMSATIVGGFLWLRPAEGFRNPDLARIVAFHVPCSMTAMVAAVVGTWYAIAYLMRRNMLDNIKSKTALSLALLYLVLTTGTGALFAKVEWGAYWNWDIKQTCILLLMLIYLAYFALRSAIEDPRKQATVASAYAVFSVFATVFLTLILPNSTPDTLHPKGVIVSKEGLDPAYRIVLYGNALGQFAVFAWIFRLQVRLEEIRERTARIGRFRREAIRPVVTERPATEPGL